MNHLEKWFDNGNKKFHSLVKGLLSGRKSYQIEMKKRYFAKGEL